MNRDEYRAEHLKQRLASTIAAYEDALASKSFELAETQARLEEAQARLAEHESSGDE